jgi:uncharacterized membrane protein HdeD (DUF308 family)
MPDAHPIDDLALEPKTVVVGGRRQAIKDLAVPLVVRGVVAVLLGLVVLAWPSSRGVAIAMVVGGATFVFGVGELLDAGRRRRRRRPWGYEVARGLGLAGVGIFLMIDSSAAVRIIAVVGGVAWALYGVLEIAEAAAEGRGGRSGYGEHQRRLRWLRGVVALGAGITVAVWPDVGPRVVAMTVGGMLVVVGVLLVFAGRQLRKAGELQPVLRVEVLTG